MKGRRFERGFTLPELLVVGLVFGVMIILSFVFIRPVDYEPARRNGERWADVSQLSRALSRYVSENGGLPEGLASEETMIGSDEEMLDLCDALVPWHAKDIPVDPLFKEEFGQAPCQKESPDYMSGYTVRQTGDNTFVVEALFAEQDETISSTKGF